MNQSSRKLNHRHGDHQKTVDALDTALRAALKRRGSDVTQAGHLSVVYKFDVSADVIGELAKWIPRQDLEPLGQPNLDAASRTLLLREILATVLGKHEYADRRPALAKWIVQRWGKVDKAGAHGYDKLVAAAELWSATPGCADLEFKHIARWSKYIAFRFPQKAAIYDARVEYALNWYLREVKDAFRFKSLESQNSIVTFLDHGVLLAAQWMGWDELEKAIKEDIQRREKGEITKSRLTKKIAGFTLGSAETYSRYVEVLRAVADKLYPKDPWGLTKTEMLLFGLATTDVPLQVFKSLRTGAQAGTNTAIQ